MADDSPEAIRRAGKLLIQKLLTVRRSLTGTETQFLNQINDCIELVRAHCRYSDTQREELVLYAIEKSCATTESEISEDTRLDIGVVRMILADLKAREIVYQVNKFIPGSDRQYHILKSRRVENVEASDAMFSATSSSLAEATANPLPFSNF
jgi:hypothetical protein